MLVGPTACSGGAGDGRADPATPPGPAASAPSSTTASVPTTGPPAAPAQPGQRPGSATLGSGSGLAPLPPAPATAPTTPAPATTTGLPPGTVETLVGRSTLRFADPPDTAPSERELVDTYHRFLRGLLASTDPPNPDDGDLAATMSPEYLAKERERLALMAASNQFAFGDYESNPRIVRPVQGTLARIEDCALDSGIRFGPDGVLRPASTGYSRSVAELDRSSGSWRVRAWNGTGQACKP
jgi:hypothetical protein